MRRRVLVTGALGQLGSELSRSLRQAVGNANVIVSDVRKPPIDMVGAESFQYLDVCDVKSLHAAVVSHNIDSIVHLSAIMSVKGEAQPDLAMSINIDGMRNILDVCRDHKLSCFIPSSMAVFGADAGKTMTKDDTILNPITVYGITKAFMEQLGGYYHRKYGVDFRSIRYPGLISAEVLPGGGTTDYAIHMLHAGLRSSSYECPVLADEPLPMMHLDDAVQGTVKFLMTPREKLRRSTYNIAAFSFTPAQLESEIRNQGCKMTIKYVRGIAQDIAHSWPDTMDDSNARQDWDWSPTTDFKTMVKRMLHDIPMHHKLT